MNKLSIAQAAKLNPNAESKALVKAVLPQQTL